MDLPLEELESRIGYRFADRELLLLALTHRSFADGSTGVPAGSRDNEQLEFLGDAVLGFLTSDLLLRLYPQFGEGRLSQLKSRIVSSAHLHEVAVGLGLGEFLRMGKGEVNHGGRAKKALLANAVEAVIAALYLDGGLEASRRFVDLFVLTEKLRDVSEDAAWVVDPKSALNELAHARKLATPKYVLVAETGPIHAKTFTVEARIGADLAAKAQGPSKKAAGSRAAEALLAVMRAGESAEDQRGGGTETAD